MSKTIVIAHPVTGAVITPNTNNPEYGTFRVDSVDKEFAKGFMNIRKRTAFIAGKISDLESLGLKAGTVMPGRIVKRMSFTPFYDGQTCRLNPTTLEPALHEGREVFIEYEYSPNALEADSWYEPAVPVASTVEDSAQHM